MKRVVLINPLISERATGMGFAAEGLGLVLPAEAVVPAPRIHRWLGRVNRLRPALLRQAARLLFVQMVPWFVGRKEYLLFTSHHAPLWHTGRHAVIIHDLIAWQFPEQSRAQHFYFRSVLPRVVRCASRVVTISETMSRELAGRFPGTEAAAATVIPSFAPRLARSPLRSWSLAERRKTGKIICVGARYRHKNLSLVCAALGAEPARGLSLAVAGCRRRIWPELAELERTGRVTALEYASDAELDELYASALALVYPSLAEGQGLPPLEAMAAGCPVICADIPVLRETGGAAAWYVDPHDPSTLAALLGRMASGNDDPEIEEHRRSGGQRVAALGLAALQAKWRNFLDSA